MNFLIYPEFLLEPYSVLKPKRLLRLGWEILTDFSNDQFALLHTGKNPGVSTLAIWFPNSKNGYIIFLNGDNVRRIIDQPPLSWR